MSLICNALVFVTITRTKSLRHPSLLMLCSLSISDLIWALFTVVRNSLTFVHPYMCLEKSLEKTCFGILCYLATLSNLAMISRDRYLAMSRPIWYRNHVMRSSTRVVKATLSSWLSCVLTTLVVYLLSKTATTSAKIIFVVIFLFYVVCIVLILLNYIGFILKSRRHSRNLRKRAGNMRAAAEKEKKTDTNCFSYPFMFSSLFSTSIDQPCNHSCYRTAVKSLSTTELLTTDF